mmetsp:Transcript_20244/g.46878  ORF Transcript_20244/g.46878 Transcript_20244/m.46878 type:complete len:225 (-) Transcript_20244:218-892(-)
MNDNAIDRKSAIFPNRRKYSSYSTLNSSVSTSFQFPDKSTFATAHRSPLGLSYPIKTGLSSLRLSLISFEKGEKENGSNRCVCTFSEEDVMASTGAPLLDVVWLPPGGNAVVLLSFLSFCGSSNLGGGGAGSGGLVRKDCAQIPTRDRMRNQTKRYPESRQHKHMRTHQSHVHTHKKSTYHGKRDPLHDLFRDWCGRGIRRIFVGRGVSSNGAAACGQHHSMVS